MAMLRTVLSCLVCLQLTLIELTDAQTAISFEFKQLFSSISDVGEFQRLLEADLIKDFKFPSNSFQNVKVTETTTGGLIKVDMTLQIDTSNDTLVNLRTNLEDSLKSERYSFVYNSTQYVVQGSSVVVQPSFWDHWNQLAFEIFLAVMAALLCMAVFVFALFCYTLPMKRKRRQQLAAWGELSSLDNRGYLHDHDHRHRHNRYDADSRFETQSVASVGTLASVRGGPPDTLFDKLTYASYSVPPKHMFDYL